MEDTVHVHLSVLEAHSRCGMLHELYKLKLICNGSILILSC